MFVQAASSFWEFNIGHVIDAGLLILAFGALLISRSTETRERREGMAKAAKDREEALETQIRMHTENKERLGVLMDFHETQKEVNVSRDQQISELSKQTGMLGEMAKGMERRLQMMENRRYT